MSGDTSERIGSMTSDELRAVVPEHIDRGEDTS